MTGLYVLTMKRNTDDPWHYVRAVIGQALLEEIENPKHFVVDGSADDCAELAAIAPDWTVHRYEKPIARGGGVWISGNKWPYWELLGVALAGGDDAVVMEDDLKFARNALRRMILFRNPRDVSATQFYSGFVFREKLTNEHLGLWRTPHVILGCQAIKYTAATLQILVDWAKGPEWQMYNEADFALGICQERLGLRIANHLPCIVQHVGDVSAVSHELAAEAGIVDGPGLKTCDTSLGEGRVSRNYAGDAFDCMRLFAVDHRYR